MLTAAYQRSTIYSPTNYEVDPDNRLYWRANRRRLDAEAIRDTLLFVSGNLDPTLGGPSLEITDVKNNRRTVYSRVSRFRLDDYLQTFDFANPSLTVGKRFATSVPQQSLYFMNSQMVERQSQNLVNRLEGKPPFEAPDEAQKCARRRNRRPPRKWARHPRRPRSPALVLPPIRPRSHSPTTTCMAEAPAWTRSTSARRSWRRVEKPHRTTPEPRGRNTPESSLPPTSCASSTSSRPTRNALQHRPCTTLRVAMRCVVSVAVLEFPHSQTS